MSDVFISYSRLDKSHAATLAAGLKDRGFDVWWDVDVYGSQNFRQAIMQVLNACKVAVVIWSENAVKSEWVCDEADQAHADGKLLPTYIPPFNLRHVPIGHRQRQTVDVTRIEDIISTLRKLGLHPPSLDPPPPKPDPGLQLYLSEFPRLIYTYRRHTNNLRSLQEALKSSKFSQASVFLRQIMSGDDIGYDDYKLLENIRHYADPPTK